MTARRGRALWASTGLDTRGGVASCVRSLLGTPIGTVWDVRHVATHRNGSVGARVATFARGLLAFLGALAGRPDVVHLHTASYGSFARKALLAWLSMAVRVPVVLHVHGGGFHTFFTRSPRPVRWVVTRTLEAADGVVALGGVWADRLREIAPRADITVIPNGVRAVGAVDQPGPGEPVHAVFLGDVIADKGAFVLLDAWAKAAVDRTGPAARLTLGGSGDLARARAMVEELGIAGTVDVRGWVDPADVPGLLRSAQVLVLPSRAEGQPMAVLEAMANGLCVVATAVGGVPELVDGCGLLLAPDDVDALAAALRRVLDDRELRVRLGGAALDRIRAGYDLDVVWRRIDELYRKVVR